MTNSTSKKVTHTSSRSIHRATYHLLLVDDEEPMRRSLADILRLEGYHVDTAANGDEAILKIQDKAYDLVLLDLKMPGKDGIEVLRFLSQSSPDTLVILLTAHGSLESAIESIRLGAHDYLLKPATPDQILTSIAKALQVRAEQIQKRMLLEQLENSVKQLKGPKVRVGLIPSADKLPELTQHIVIKLENGIQVDLRRREIWSEMRKIRLTPTEGKLLGVFLSHPHQVFSHRDLVLRVQEYDTSDFEAAEMLRPLISRLRHKLSVFPDGGHWIESVRGTGYVFEVNISSPDISVTPV